MRSMAARTSLLVAALALVAAACGDSGGTDTTSPASQPTAAPSATTAAPDDEMTDDEMTDDEMGDVLEVASAEGDLGVFLAALEAAGTMDDFHGDGPFTLFIPTDQAFADYLSEAGMTQDEAFAGAEMLQALVDHHIVAMEEDADMVMGMAGESFTTMGGTSLDVTVDGETVMVGDATILRYDLHASNGIIHVIDQVLPPPAS
ncbi:MAG TPA: fasciclin domain-containing protein [Acidimicrobiia bacterium]